MTVRPWDETHPYYFSDEEDLLGENYRADRSYWSRAAGWTIEEGVALSMGYEPRAVNSEILSGVDHLPARMYAERLSFAVRARHMEHLKDFNEPASFIKWAKSQGLSFDPELEKAVGSGKKGAKAAQLREAEHLNPKVRQSLLKIALGLAMAVYGYDPKKPRSSVPREIKDELYRVGISLDEDTVRKRLTEAADELIDTQEEGS
ncbi:hypothetical protein [Methylobacterium nigriterrae]|uniref:hypothetical protein n=1 Tax=Methylobacterium nigriterrae TaxID=3127512 RepID=UPI00301403A1